MERKLEINWREEEDGEVTVIIEQEIEEQRPVIFEISDLVLDLIDFSARQARTSYHFKKKKHLKILNKFGFIAYLFSGKEFPQHENSDYVAISTWVEYHEGDEYDDNKDVKRTVYLTLDEMEMILDSPARIL